MYTHTGFAATRACTTFCWGVRSRAMRLSPSLLLNQSLQGNTQLLPLFWLVTVTCARCHAAPASSDAKGSKSSTDMTGEDVTNQIKPSPLLSCSMCSFVISPRSVLSIYNKRTSYLRTLSCNLSTIRKKDKAVQPGNQDEDISCLFTHIEDVGLAAFKLVFIGQWIVQSPHACVAVGSIQSVKLHKLFRHTEKKRNRLNKGSETIKTRNKMIVVQ